MKKLITAKTIQTLRNNGETVLLINDDTLITPSAKDAARSAGICFVHEDEAECQPEVKQPEANRSEAETPCCNMSYDRQVIVEAVIKALDERGILDKILD